MPIRMSLNMPERGHVVGSASHRARRRPSPSPPPTSSRACCRSRASARTTISTCTCALDALDHPHQQVVGVVVGGRARVAGAVLVVVPVADRRARRSRAASPAASSRSSRSCSCPGCSAGRRARRRRRGPPASCRRRGRAARRTPTASRSAAGTSTRSSRRRRRARRCGSPTGSRSRRSAGTASPDAAAAAARARRAVRRRVVRRAWRTCWLTTAPARTRGRSTPSGSTLLFLELVEVRRERRRGGRPQRLRDVGPGRVEQLLACCARPSASAAIRAALALEAVGARTRRASLARLPHGRAVPGADDREVLARAQPLERRAGSRAIAPA